MLWQFKADAWADAGQTLKQVQGRSLSDGVVGGGGVVVLGGDGGVGGDVIVWGGIT